MILGVRAGRGPVGSARGDLAAIGFVGDSVADRCRVADFKEMAVVLPSRRAEPGGGALVMTYRGHLGITRHLTVAPSVTLCASTCPEPDLWPTQVRHRPRTRRRFPAWRTTVPYLT